MQEVVGILSQIAVLVFALVFAFAVIAMKPLYALINANAKSAVYDFLKAHAATYVSDLAKSPQWENLSGSEKKQRAILWLVELARKYNYELDEALAGKLVEEAYIGIKRIVAEANIILLDATE